jgi:flagellar protein FliO/FliZ
MNLFLLAVDSQPPEGVDFGMLMIRMLIFLGVVIALIYIVLRKGLPLLMQAQGFRNRTVKILERVPVDQKRTLLVVEVQDRVYLLGSAEGQINVLMELDRDKMNLQSVPGEKSKFEQILKKTVPAKGEP